MYNRFPKKEKTEAEKLLAKQRRAEKRAMEEDKAEREMWRQYASAELYASIPLFKAVLADFIKKHYCTSDFVTMPANELLEAVGKFETDVTEGLRDYGVVPHFFLQQQANAPIASLAMRAVLRIMRDPYRANKMITYLGENEKGLVPPDLEWGPTHKM